MLCLFVYKDECNRIRVIILYFKGDASEVKSIKTIPRITLLLLVLLLQTSLLYAQPLTVTFVNTDEYRLSKTQITLIDVRSANSREKSKMEVPGSTWIDPLSGPAFKDFIETADKNASYTIFCSCKDDNYSIRAAQLLMKNGFKNVSVLEGGWNSIIKDGIEISPLVMGGK
jgi:rhodanese-related sulfurtransferase